MKESIDAQSVMFLHLAEEGDWHLAEAGDFTLGRESHHRKLVPTSLVLLHGSLTFTSQAQGQDKAN